MDTVIPFKYTETVNIRFQQVIYIKKTYYLLDLRYCCPDYFNLVHVSWRFFYSCDGLKDGDHNGCVCIVKINLVLEVQGSAEIFSNYGLEESIWGGY